MADDLIDNDEEVASSKKTSPAPRILMAKIDTLFMTKTAENPYPLGPHKPIKPI